MYSCSIEIRNYNRVKGSKHLADYFVLAMRSQALNTIDVSGKRSMRLPVHKIEDIDYKGSRQVFFSHEDKHTIDILFNELEQLVRDLTVSNAQMLVEIFRRGKKIVIQ